MWRRVLLVDTVRTCRQAGHAFPPAPGAARFQCHPCSSHPPVDGVGEDGASVKANEEGLRRSGTRVAGASVGKH